MKESQKNMVKHSYHRKIILGIFDAFLFCGFVFLVFMLWIYYSATPAASALATRKIAETSIIYDRTGENVLYELYGEENRKIVSHDEIPDFIRKATVATEDTNFYKHIGIDPVAIIRAFKINVQNNDIRQGASTITQQLARSAFLTREQTFKRKFLEAIFALKIERHYSKDEILDQYLNQVPYGANAYGVEAASITYFGKEAKDLTLDEAAFLAALPKAPSYYSPYSTHGKAAIVRQKLILEHMAELKMISDDELRNALKVDTLAKIKDLNTRIVAPHFVFYVLEQLENKYGSDFLRTGGLKIYTTLNLDMQKIGEDVVAAGAARNVSRGASNAALVAVDPKNGDVLTMVGSKNYFDKTIDGQVNVATSQRQPGSSFKPFVYAHAFELGYQPETNILDAPTNFGPDGSGKDYMPNNYNGQFHGLLPLRNALSMSLNVPAVKVLYLATIDGSIDLAHRMGITTLNDRKRYGLSLVLGGGEVKLVDMASAFSVFATDGIKNPVRSVLKIADSNGIVFEQKQNSQRVLDEQVARKINSILSDNVARSPVFGSRSPLILDGKTVAAKTGTTSEFRDAWTVGYTPSLAVGVWAGNNDNSPMKDESDGVFVAAPIWHDYMTKVLSSKANENFIPYDVSMQSNSINNNGMSAVINYYLKKSGRQISAEKALKADQSRIEKRIEYVSADLMGGASMQNQIQIAMPAMSDPMFARWAFQPLANVK
jgi:1A family penicillin-binding protein